MPTLDEIQKLDFITKTDNKSRCQQIKYLVGLGMQGYRMFLEGKRQRLRVLLEEEAQQFEKEYEDMIHVQINENIQKNKALLLRYMDQHKIEVKNFVDLKQIIQNYDNCDEIRTNIVKQTDREVRKCQLQQIEEKHQQSCLNKYGGPGWEEVRKRMLEKSDAVQANENCLKREYMRQTVNYLDYQVWAKERKMVEEKLAKQLYIKQKIAEDERLIELAKLKMKKKNIHRNRDLFEQVAQRGFLIDEQKQFDMKFINSVNNHLKMEKVDPRIAKNKLKQQSIKDRIYAHHMENVKKSKIEETDKAIDEMKARIDCCALDKKMSNKSNLSQEARKNHKLFLEKIYENEDLEKTAEARKRQEGFVSKSLPMKVREPINKPEEFRRRRCELRKQIDYLNSLKAAESEVIAKESEKCQEYSEQCLRSASQFLVDKTDYLPPHPNTKLFRCQ